MTFYLSDMQGPSPRVRGSLIADPMGYRADGTIPACAGEPEPDESCSRCCADHPRVCGGASRSTSIAARLSGPSPRVRGSRDDRITQQRLEGTIPACAGEPSARKRSRRSCRDHPRVCGGAAFHNRASRPCQGPSPRVRGSHHANDHPHRRDGTIPACAGEPGPVYRGEDLYRDHPRVCGGAPAATGYGSVRRGPSPRVRGSLEPIE